MTDPVVAPVAEPIVEKEPVATSDKTVPETAYEEVKRDMLKFKQELRAKEAELEKSKTKEKELKLAALREKEDYKAMFETANQEKEKLNNDLQQTRRAISDSTKWNAVSAELQSLGINPSVLGDVEKLFDLETIEIEITSHGRHNVLNAKEEAAKFKAMRPFYFQSAGKPNVNTGTPTIISSDNVTFKMLDEAEAEFKKTRSPEAEKKYKTILYALKHKGAH